MTHANIGAIFDCDGTLVDSAGGWRSVERQFASLCGHDMTEEDMELLATFTLPETGVFYHERYGLGESPQQVVEMADEILLNYYRTQVQLRPGVGEFLEGLASAGVPMTMASSSPMRYLKGCIENLGIGEYLSLVLSADELGVPKREPLIYQLCAQHMGTEYASSWGFEDSIYAVRTLVNNGFKCAGCYDRDDYGTMEQLQAEATLVIPSFAVVSAKEFLERASR